MTACLTLEQIHALVEGPPAGPGDPSAAHVQECARCRRALRRAASDDALMENLRRALAPEEHAAGPSAPDAAAPEAVPGFTILERLHQGGQGVVYRALDEGSGGIVALKVYGPGRAATPELRARFERETALARHLDHPDIVRVRSHGAAGGTPWMSMDLVDGLHLDEWIRVERPDAVRRLALALRIARAVAYAHQSGVVHRDLKPSNVLVTSAGEPRILDFGLACPADEDGAARLTGTGAFAGTLAYCAPEQVREGRGPPGTAADVYALGIVFFEMFTGELPYDVRGSVPAAARVIAEAEPADPAPLAPDLPPGVRTILLTALEKEPRRRYRDAQDLADDLTRAAAGEPVRAPRQGAAARWRRSFRRHRRAIAAAAAVTAAVSACAAIALLAVIRAGDDRRIADETRAALEEILASARPDRMGGGVSLVEVLEEIAPRIEAAFSASPDARASLRMTLGETCLRLYALEDAEAHFRAAAERFDAAGAGSSLAAARCALAVAVLGTGKSPAALPALRSAAAALRDHAGAGDGDRTEASLALAFALEREGTPEALAEAGALAATAREEAVRSPAGSPVRGAVLHLSAVLRSRAGDDGEAEALFRRALDAFDSAPGAGGRRLEAAADHAGLLVRRGRGSEAATILDTAAGSVGRDFGEARATHVARHLARRHFGRGEDAVSAWFSRRALERELRRWAERCPTPRGSATSPRGWRRGFPALTVRPPTPMRSRR